MTNHYISLFVAAFLLTACNQAPDEEVVATYKGGTVDKEEVQEQVDKLSRFNDKLKGLAFDALDEQYKKEIIREIVAKEVISQQARQANTHKNEAIRNAVTEFENRLIQKEFLYSIAEKEASEEKIKAKYDILSEKLKGQQERRLKHILVEDEAQAKQIYTSLKQKKSSFEALAKKHSKDPLTAKQGGDLGYVLPGQMVEPFEDAAFALAKIGDISKPVKTHFGWHVIALDDLRDAQAAPFEEVSDAIRQEIMQQAINNYVENQLEKADIQPVIQ